MCIKVLHMQFKIDRTRSNNQLDAKATAKKTHQRWPPSLPLSINIPQNLGQIPHSIRFHNSALIIILHRFNILRQRRPPRKRLATLPTVDNVLIVTIIIPMVEGMISQLGQTIGEWPISMPSSNGG